MPVLVVDFNELQRNKQMTLPKEVAKLLDDTKHNFISDNKTSLSNRKTGLTSVFQSESSVIDVSFSHCLVKTGANQWNVIIGKNKGSGSFGAVNQSTLKIIVVRNEKREFVAHLLPAADVVKIQQSKHISHADLLENAYKEAMFQRRHGVTVSDPIDAFDKVITVLEDCGTSLNRLFPLQGVSFKHRLALAGMIASEMLLLEQRHVVHRDLKPENICCKELPNGKFQIIFIDFGLAQDIDCTNKAANGTYYYMAPEVYNRKGGSHASDLYALAPILGELMGAKDVLRYKRAANNVRAIVAAPYCFDGMFDDCDDAGVDYVLLEDFKMLLNKLSDPKPENRPSINHLNKFLITIPSRADQYARFNKEWGKMTGLCNKYQGFLATFHVSQKTLTLNKLKPNPIWWDNSANDDAFYAALIKAQQDIKREVGLLPTARSHLSLAFDLVKENRRADFENQDYPFPRLDHLITLLEAENNKFTNGLKVFDQSLTQSIQSPKFSRTNSSGIHKITTILNTTLSPLAKIEQIKTLAQSKITPGFWYRFSHSTIFGKGRHKNIEELYTRLSKIQPDPKHKEEYLLESQLQEIGEFIKTSNFIH